MVEIRPVDSIREHEVALALNNEIAPEHAIDMGILRSMLQQIPRQQHWLARDGDEPVATASAMIEPGFELPRCRNLVRPERRRQGIGTSLYEAISDWARGQGKQELEAWLDEGTDGADFVRKRGFREISREPKVTLELAGTEPPDVPPPDGIEIITLAGRLELLRGLYEVYSEASPDIPGSDDESVPPFEVWRDNDMDLESGGAEATFVAIADDEVVGFAKFSLTTAQPTVAFHDLTGVKRGWRGRGIAGALKARQIAWAVEQGYERLETHNEERNAPIRKLNERFGYEPSTVRIRFRGPVASAGAASVD